MRERIDALTGLRAYAALWVVVVHFYSANDLGFLRPLVESGHFGVEIFFVLSGFILTYNYGGWFCQTPAKDLRRFAIYRFARVYPVYLFILVAFPLVLLPLNPNILPPDRPFDTVATFILNALLLQAWGFIEGLSWNQAAWSVSAEMFCYILFPLIVIFARKVSVPTRWFLLLALFVLQWMRFPNAPLRWLFDWTPPTDRTSFAHGVLIVRYSLFFMAGVLTCLICQHWPRNRNWSVVVIVAIAGIVATVYLPYGTFHVMLLVSSCLLVASLSLNDGSANRLFDNPVVLYLGEISYSLYLCHIPALLMFRWGFGSSDSKLYGTIELAFVFAVSAVLYHGIENPSRRFIRQLNSA